MKINAKLFILVFSIITLISVLSAFIYHTLSQQLLKNQQSKNLVNSANDLIFAFQEIVFTLDEEFKKFEKELTGKSSDSRLDFLFSVDPDGTIDQKSMLTRSKLNIYTDVINLSEFYNYNTDLVIRTSTKSGKEYYYGTQIDKTLLQQLSEKIRAELALVEQDVVTKFSNNSENQYYLPLLSKFARELKDKNNFELLYSSFKDFEFSATHYKPLISLNKNSKIDFLIFNISKEAAAFKDTMTLVTTIIVTSGILLAIIVLLLFTSKFRSQIQYITRVVENIAAGDLSKKVKIITKDEIGNLGVAFNNMLEEIEKRDKVEKEYSDFISLINQNPSLEKLGEAALEKIVKTTSVDTGAFYLFENSDLKQFAVHGLSIENQLDKYFSFYKKATENKEILDIEFKENQPVIKTGITELKINYLYILPIYHNNQNIAILELASVNLPKIDIKKYLLRIKDQLAIGVANGKSLTELKNLVTRLQNLNSAYQKQNLEIIDKNEELLKLHSKLKKGTEELEKQTQKAVESEKIKSQFLANMSHELRTPQNSILGLTELILNDNTTSLKTKERLRIVLSNGKKLLNLIENILEYSKLESGNSDIRESEIYLSDFLHEVKNFVSPLFWEKECEFIVKTPDNFDYMIITDVKKLEQIAFNLIGNASKFTNRGFVKLELIVDKDDFIMTVEDTGPGISDEDKSIIFDEFRQIDGNLNRKFSGTGLGLAICKRYCELLKANMDVESELSKGSKFTVTLSSIVKEKKAKNVQVACRPPVTNKFRSVIVSDGNDSIELVKGYLNSNNVDVFVFRSSEFSVDSISSIKPNIIILDILLENINGWKLLTELKLNLNTSHLPLVVINMDEEANCGLGLNIFEYYPKPLNSQNIIEAVNNLNQLSGIEFGQLCFHTGEKVFNSFEKDFPGCKLIKASIDTNELVDEAVDNKPDLIIIDLTEENTRPLQLVTDLYDDIKTRSIPIIAFIDKNRVSDSSGDLQNSILETTLIKGKHPLDALKVIKDRINLLDASIFYKISGELEASKILPSENQNMESDFLPRAKILIVDDDADTRFTIGEMVESFGFTPLFASDGYQCLMELDKGLPDLILLDIMMPRLDGFQTVKKIRERFISEKLNIYALTAYAMLSDKEIIEKNGFNGLITKPVNSEKLSRKLNQILSTVG